MEGIRNGCLVTIKKLSATFVGSGGSLDKHQVEIVTVNTSISLVCYLCAMYVLSYKINQYLWVSLYGGISFHLLTCTHTHRKRSPSMHWVCP